MGRTDQVSGSVDASPRDVYAALIDPTARTAWLPPAGMTGHIERWDARPGGGYRMVLTYTDARDAPGKSSADSDVAEARFVHLDDGERVVEAVEFESDDPANAGIMTMSWTLIEHAGRTTVTVTADDVPPGIDPADHDAGLRSTLSQLAEYVNDTLVGQRIEPGE